MIIYVMDRRRLELWLRALRWRLRSRLGGRPWARLQPMGSGKWLGRAKGSWRATEGPK